MLKCFCRPWLSRGTLWCRTRRFLSCMKALGVCFLSPEREVWFVPVPQRWSLEVWCPNRGDTVCCFSPAKSILVVLGLWKLQMLLYLPNAYVALRLISALSNVFQLLTYSRRMVYAHSEELIVLGNSF